MPGADRRSLLMLAAGHMFTDMNQSFVPAMLPFLVAMHHLSYAAAGALVLAGSVSSSVIQPLFGHTSDRRAMPWLLPAGVAIAALGIAAAGLAPSYWLLFLAIVVSGIGVAAFHPEGSRFANHVSGQRRASGMSVFAVGGNAGFALGPIAATPLLVAYGLNGTLAVLVPAALLAVMLARAIPRLVRFAPPARSERNGGIDTPAQWGAFWRVLTLIVLRTLVYFGLLTFVPLYYIGVLHTTKEQASLALGAMLIAGAAGTLLGGRLADTLGKRTILLAAMAALIPLLYAFPRLGAVPATAALIFAGVALISQSGVSVVLGQEYLPGRIGVASGLTLGFGIGLGGAAVPLLGLIADRFGLVTAMEVLVAVPVAGTMLALSLPSDGPSATGAVARDHVVAGRA